MNAAENLITSVHGKFGTILADPPWQFTNRTGKMAPEHKRLRRYGTMTIQEIKELPVPLLAADKAHLYLWVPNALLQWGLDTMAAWGFEYKSNIVWFKIRKDRGAERPGGRASSPQRRKRPWPPRRHRRPEHRPSPRASSDYDTASVERLTASFVSVRPGAS
jgi:hypothetical protein